MTDSAALLDVEELKLAINSGHDLIECNGDGARLDPGAQAEGFANATPLAFTSVFYPLGREPKQFDIFYLGCADAFSKKAAKVAICFELADASANVYSTIGRGSYFNELIASVGKDLALHLNSANTFTGAVTKFRDRAPWQPPIPGANSVVQDGNAMALFRADWRPPLWKAINIGSEANYVAVSAGATVWVWQEDIVFKERSGWISYGAIASGAGNAQVTGLVYVEGSTPMLYASFDGKLYSHFAHPCRRLACGRKSRSPAPEPRPSCLGSDPLRTPVVNSNQWDVTGLVGVISDGTNALAYAVNTSPGTIGQCVKLDGTRKVRAGTIPTGIVVDAALQNRRVRLGVGQRDETSVRGQIRRPQQFKSTSRQSRDHGSRWARRNHRRFARRLALRCDGGHSWLPAGGVRAAGSFAGLRLMRPARSIAARAHPRRGTAGWRGL